MPSFLEEMKPSFPPSLPLPPELEATLAWMEANGCVRGDAPGERYATLFPAASGLRSPILLRPCIANFAHVWTGNPDPAVAERLAMFLRTGGDGSYAGLWLDDEGRTRIVHCGSGSGSTFAGVMTGSVVDLLRLLAIGYEELCWPENFALTPYEVWEEGDFDEDEQYPDPAEFRAFVERTFKTPAPPRASELIPSPGDFSDDPASDPFLAWVERVRR